MTSSIFLDWFGVLADNSLMTQRWRIVEAKLLQERYGGALREWVSVHDKTFDWYATYWSRHGPRSRTSYRTIWRIGETGWIKRTLEWAGVNHLMSEPELFKFSREIVYETARRIDSAYAYSRRSLRELRQAGCRLFLVSGADSGYIRGALEATRLGSFFERTYSPETLNAFKGSLSYWKKILRLSKSDPKFSVVLDDRPKFLRVPARLGLKPILVTRDPTPSEFTTVRTVKQLLSPRLLPNLKSPTNQRKPRTNNA